MVYHYIVCIKLFDDRHGRCFFTDKEKIKRINQLANKAKAEGLTDEEKAEQEALRNEYRENFRKNLVGQLENTYVIDEHGNKRKLLS